MLTGLLIFLYRACFILGLGYTILAFIFGEVLNLRDFSKNIRISENFTVNPSCAVTFMTVFGGTGITTAGFMHQIPLSILVSAVFGTLTAFLMYYFIISPFDKINSLHTSHQSNRIIGQKATVTEDIPKNHIGVVHYYINGSEFSSPAKSEDGKEIIQNAMVEIVNIQKSTLYVREILEP